MNNLKISHNRSPIAMFGTLRALVLLLFTKGEICKTTKETLLRNKWYVTFHQQDRFTTCILSSTDIRDNQMVTSHGVTRCCDHDEFVVEQGQLISFERAVMNLDEAVRDYVKCGL